MLAPAPQGKLQWNWDRTVDPSVAQPHEHKPKHDHMQCRFGPCPGLSCLHDRTLPTNLPTFDTLRKRILDKPDNVITWATPYGYTEPHDVQRFAERFGLSPDSPFVRAAELRYLEDTQDRELAPLWLELRENGIDAISHDSASSPDDDDDGVLSIQLADNESYDEPNPVTIPDRRELWWREEDEYRWNCGPIVRIEYYRKDDGKRGLRIVGRSGMTTENEVALLHSILDRDRANGTLPDVELIEAARTDIRGRMAFYGPNWALSLLTPEEQDTLPHVQALHKWLDLLDNDAQRDALQAEDDLAHYQQDRPEYAGNGDLGNEAWDSIAQDSFYQQFDMDPFYLSN